MDPPLVILALVVVAVQSFDLQNAVPSGISLSGLSEPKFDGVNHYRVPTAQDSSVAFSTQGVTFAAVTFQLYSRLHGVTGTVVLDGQQIGSFSAVAGTFQSPATLGGFTQAGHHTLSIRYRCDGRPCSGQVNQYATVLQISDARPADAREPVGFGSSRWWLDAPDSPLEIRGTAPLIFDGAIYSRKVAGDQVVLRWPMPHVLNTSVSVYAPEAFRVTTRVEGQVRSVETGDGRHAVTSTVSLVNTPAAREISVQIECLDTRQSSCGIVYAPNVVATTGTGGSWAEASVAIGLSVLLLILAGWMLRPLTVGPAVD